MNEPLPSSSLILLCIDLQPVFLKAVAHGDVVQRRSAFAIRCAIGLGIPVVFSEQVPQKLGGTAAELLALAPEARVFGKETFSALACDAIRSAVTTHPAEHVLLCGIETSVCVYQSALDALRAGMHVTILSDAVGARRPEDAQVCLDALVRAGAHVLPSETVFYALLHDVGHPFFKAYTKLVKEHA